MERGMCGGRYQRYLAEMRNDLNLVARTLVYCASSNYPQKSIGFPMQLLPINVHGKVFSGVNDYSYFEGTKLF